MLTPAQRQAIDPQASVWLTASAGSGKTKVLIDRLLALMLSGHAPERILCLTFTKAAAAEMANRLHQRLSQWAVISEGELREDLQTFTSQIDPEMIQRARKLLTLFLDTPGGLKIQTLHSFCQLLLRQFPLEAGLNPAFSVLEERQATDLLRMAQDRMLRNAHQDTPTPLAQAINCLAGVLHEKRLEGLLQEAFSKRFRLDKVFTQENHHEKLQQALDVSPGQTHATIWDAFLEASLKHQASFRSHGNLLESGKAKDQRFWEIARNWFDDPTPDTYKAYQSLFLTATGDPRKQVLSSALLKQNPALEGLLSDQLHCIETYECQRKCLNLYQQTWAFWVIVQEVFKIYQDLKKQQAVLDYDDLIFHSLNLLKGKHGGAGWVLYKLDRGIDHILVDEAQDTSEEQWEVLKRLTEAFFEIPAAVGKPSPRTLFVVGDPKQSIYRFQGASPASFFQVQGHFKTQARQHKGRWHDLSLDVSFRSSPAVLEAVDQVFASPALQEGIFTQNLSHKACEAKRNKQGVVELWPLVPASERLEKPPAWEIPLHPQQIQLPSISLARELAHRIASWCKGERRLASGSAVRPKDILVLVRKRTVFVDALVRALKEQEIPVAGADRLFFGDQLAILDLVKLGEWVLFPEDDLTLAVVLKGPFLRFNEDELFQLAYQRGKQPLWERLQEAAGREQGSYQVACEFLKRLQGDFKTIVSPYAFYHNLLFIHHGKQKLLESLGPEATDSIEAFLNLVQAFEHHHPPSLQGLLAWLTKADVNLKRDLEHDVRDEVRIMTVHGSKGLQAPVVILADTAQAPSKSSQGLLWGKNRGDFLMLLAPSAAEDVPLSALFKAEEAQLQEQEYYRLLYVAMTRAEEHLILSGWHNHTQTAFQKSWYPYLESTLENRLNSTSFSFQSKALEHWNGKGYRFQTGNRVSPTSQSPNIAPITDAIPDWLFRAALPAGPSPLIRPSGRDEKVKPIGAKTGEILHLLFQTSRELSPDVRLIYLEKALKRFPEFKTTWEKQFVQFEAVFNNPECAFLFTPQTRAEVPITALYQGKPFVGRIDYVWQEKDQIRIVDFKTGHVVRDEKGIKIPSQYRQQLDMYAAGMTALYPGAFLSCGLLWFQTAELVWV